MLFTDFTMKFASLWNSQALEVCDCIFSVFFLCVCVPLFNYLLDMRWIIAIAVIV